MISWLVANAQTRLSWAAFEAFSAVEKRLRDWSADVDDAILSLPQWETKIVPWVAGTSSSVDVRCVFTPIAVWIGNVAISDDAGTTGPVSALSWSPSDGGFRINTVTELTNGTHYELTLVVMGGK